ncbi:putative late blight resistance protein R1B-17 [Salvia divinorum]|uniref:Late blight resistance protein R1B-17 n=1 Tax=Salvia divinorum TaxID=28513 RepID=A0ABD1HH60_SALDI
MAAAFAALVSLQNNIRLIDNHPNHTFPFEEEQIQSLWESVCFLIDFMDSYDNSHGVRRETAEALEMRIARAAQVAEDVIESHMVDQIRCGKTRPSRFLLDLQKVAIGMDYMKRKASNVIERSGMLDPPSHSSSSSSAAQSIPLLTSSMVGFDDILLNLLDLLTGVPLSRRVIPIQGMGGIVPNNIHSSAPSISRLLESFRSNFTVAMEHGRIPKDNDEYEEEVCCMCLDDLYRGSVTTLDCRHEFHSDCIRRWLARGQNFCPLCKAPAIK